jgi:hypothetical protein
MVAAPTQRAEPVTAFIPYLMVFTGDGLPDVERRSVAVEPMTCARRTPSGAATA